MVVMLLLMMMKLQQSKEEAVLAVQDDDDHYDTADTSAFKASEIRECSSNVSGRKGEGESAWRVGDEAWLCDSGACTHVTPSADGAKSAI